MSKANLNLVTPVLNAVKALMNLRGEDKKAAESLIKDFGINIDLEKAQRAQDLTNAEMVADHWTEGHLDKGITKEEVKTGPGQSASGDGAEKMIREYSSTAPQHGTTLTAYSLARILGPVNSSVKALLSAMEKNEIRAAAHGEAIVAIAEALKGGAVTESKVAKADDDDKDDDEKEVVEINEKAARKGIKTAKSLIRKAAVLKADAEDEDDKAAAKALKVEARKLLSKAGGVLFKARNAAAAAGSVELRNEIRSLAKADDIEVVEEEEEEEDTEKSKAAKAAAQAVEDAKKAKDNADGNQADRANADGNQVDAAKAAALAATAEVEKMASRIDGALSGLAMLSTDVKGLLATVAGASRPGPAMVAKATGTAEEVIPIADRISAMEATGDLSPTEAFAAREIAAKTVAVEKKLIDPSYVAQRLASAPAKVQELFRQAA